MRKDIRAAVCSRELSWLRFNTRVLEQAEDERVPLMERFMFRSIWSANLDEFCRTRIGKLLTLSLSDNGVRDVRTGMHPSEQLERISGHILTELPRADRAFISLEKELEAFGVKRLRYDEAPAGAEADMLTEIFDREYLGRLSPVIVAPDDDRPVVRGGRLYVLCHLESQNGWAIGLADCTDLPPATPVNGGNEYILTDRLIALSAGKLFPEHTVTETVSLRVTRSAFLDVEPAYDEGADTIGLMSNFMDSREILIAVCTQLSAEVSPLFRYHLLERLSLDDSLILVTGTPLHPGFFPQLYSRMKSEKELYYSDYAPALNDAVPLAEMARERDVLLCYPYDSMEPFLQMLEQAAADSRVTSIKMTLYRLADDSRIVSALCAAARAGKRVFVCIELRARFSECDNISAARELAAAGCRVVCGIQNYKVHSKLCRIDFYENGGTFRLTQIGTGNYNESTAQHYTDFSFVTCDPDAAADADRVFDALARQELPPRTGALTTSPSFLKSRILSLIDMEIAAANAGEPAYFGAKVNGLSDPDIIEKLVEASCAGVRTELIVRGICCIKPGVPGLTDNITVISIVDRFLEHGRIYISGSGTRRIVYISSADLMTRNLDRRVEAAVRISDAGIADRLCDYFAGQMSDTANSRVMRADGSYSFASRHGKSSQQTFMERFEQHTGHHEPAPAPEQPSFPEPEPVIEDIPAAEPVPAIEETPAAEPAAENLLETVPAEQPELSAPPVKKSIFRRIIDFFRRKK